MRYTATVGDRELTIDVQDNGHVRAVSLNGRPLTVDCACRRRAAARRPAGRLLRRIEYPADRTALERAYAPSGSQEAGDCGRCRPGHRGFLEIHGRPYIVGVRDERSRALASLAGGAHVAGDATIRAPMPGLVASVLAAEGAAVERGQTVVVLEAMKMENDLTAPRAGIVKAVHVTKGQTVGQNDVLAVMVIPWAWLPRTKTRRTHSQTTWLGYSRRERPSETVASGAAARLPRCTGRR